MSNVFSGDLGCRNAVSNVWGCRRGFLHHGMESRAGPGQVAQGTSPGERVVQGLGFSLCTHGSHQQPEKEKPGVDWHVRNETFHLEIQTLIILVVLMKNGVGGFLLFFFFSPKRANSMKIFIELKVEMENFR